MSEPEPRRGRHARPGTFARDVAVAAMAFLAAGVVAYLGLSAVFGPDEGDTEVAGITVTAPLPASSVPATEDAASVSTVPTESSTTEVPTPTSTAVSTTSPPATGVSTSSAVTPTTVPDPSDVRVQVLNAVGTTGLAARVSSALAESGYQMLTAQDHPERLVQSQIRFREPYGPAAFELAERFPDAEVVLDGGIGDDVDILVLLGGSYREE